MNQPIAASKFSGRIEDDALLRGQGRFGDDVKPEGSLAAHFVRSPHAFARIERIDTTAAKSAPGVVAVFTAADLAAAHYHSISHPHPMPGRGGKVAVAPHRPALAARAGDACRRAGGHGGGDQRGRGAGRRRENRGRLRGVRAGHRRARGDSSRARRSSGRRRPAISASTGARRPIPTARNTPRSIAPSTRPRMWCASNWSTSAWWWPRSSRAPPPPATTPRASSSLCAAARKLSPPCAARSPAA